MTLYEFIKNEKLARTIFAKGEIDIIKKQLLGINLTQSEKNRLSRSIRLKFKFIKKCSVFKDEFEIKKGGEIFKQLKILKDNMLLDKLGKKIKKIYIFGSFVKNEMDEFSDVDIAIEFDSIDLKEATLFKKRMMVKKNKLFDLSIFNNLPKNIQDEVKNNGKILYKSE